MAWMITCCWCRD